MLHERMTDKQHQPTEKARLKVIGRKSSLWLKLREYVDKHYDFVPETIFYGEKYGWTVRYRKSGKTLLSIFPEKNAFTVLVVLGKKEVDKVAAEIEHLNTDGRSLFENSEQLRDGRWLWISVKKAADVESIRSLLTAKRKPKKA